MRPQSTKPAGCACRPGAWPRHWNADERQRNALFEQFDRSIGRASHGRPGRPLFVPHDHASQEAFAVVQRRVDVLKAAWRTPPAPGAERVAEQADAFVSRIDAFVSAIESTCPA